MYTTIKNPLYPVGKRLRAYTVSVIFAWIIIWVQAILSEDANEEDKMDNMGEANFIIEIQKMKQMIFEERIIWKISLIIPLIFFIIIGAVSIVKAIVSFKQPGLGQNVRK